MVGISEFVLAVGALVGGLTARQRKIELESVNEKLRLINVQLRKQARAGTTYAPGLVYAPPLAGGASAGPFASGSSPSSPSSSAGSAAATAYSSASASASAAAASAATASAATATVPELKLGPACDLDEVRQALREGKRLLKEGNASVAMVFFNKALMMTRQQSDGVQERRAVRGLAAAKRLLGDRLGAIALLEKVLELSQSLKEYTGDTDALGTIADIYTELGNMEKAGHWYDRYISKLQEEVKVDE